MEDQPLRYTMYTNRITMYPKREKRRNKTEVYIKSIWKSVCSFGREFCMLSTIHGLNHIAEQNRHWSERLLWVIMFVASVAGAVNLSLGQWQRYNENPTVVTLEKDFRSWRFSYPSVTTCDVNRTDLSKLPQVVKSYWNVSPEDDKYDYYSRFVQTVTNSNLYNLTGFLEFQDDEELNVNLFQLALEVSPPLQIKTTWSEIEHQTAKWHPVMTETGVCYVINSLAVYDQALAKPNSSESKSLPKTCKSLTCNIMMEFTLTADVYSIHNCRRSCRNQLALKLCGCKPFYNFYEEGAPCNTRGMACLAPYADRLANINGVRCACLPQCIDSVFSELSTDDIVWEKGPFMQRGSIKLVVQGQRTRYTREIVFHFQDLVVSFGGATGLFLGASFISFVEILYFILDRFFKIFNKNEEYNNIIKVKEARMSYEAQEINKLNNLLNVSKIYNN